MTFGFIIVIYDEPQKQIDACVRSVRNVYPDKQIILISDGGPDIIIPDGCRFIRGEHLKELRFGGAWVHRLCEVGLTLNTDKVIKIDPDTRVVRPFREMPDADYFGELMGNNKIGVNIIRGGCKGYSSRVLRQAFVEKWFLDSVFVNNDIFSYKKRGRSNALSEDQATAWGFFKHGVSFTCWPEIMNENFNIPRFATKHRVFEPS